MTNELDNKVDDFLFIDNLQTTVRQLSVFSQIIIALNNKQLPKKVLEQLLITWSISEEKINNIYNKGKGKITQNGRKTAALGYYLQISTFLGLTTRFNDVYMNTKMSQTFLYFLNQKDNKSADLGLGEKLFFLFKLFSSDADGIILCLSMLNNGKEKKQRVLQEEFKEGMNQRLLSKMDLAKSIVKNKIANKYRTINFTWKNANSYAEHIIAPRLEWLFSLGLVKINRINKDTLYSLTENGMKLYNLLPNLRSAGIKDFNQEWLYSKYFNDVAEVYNVSNSRNFFDLKIESQQKELGESLERALKAVKSSLSFKLPIIEAYLFISLDLLLNAGIVINFIDIEEKLKRDFSYNSKQYLLKIAGRQNEGYITTTIKK